MPTLFRPSVGKLRACGLLAVSALTLVLGLGAALPAHAAALTPQVATTGTLATGPNAATVTMSFVVGTTIPSGGSLYTAGDFAISGCSTSNTVCSAFTVSASSSNISGSTVTMLYTWGGSFSQFKVALTSGVAAGETITYTFPASVLSIASPSATYTIGTYSTMVNTGQITLNRLDDSGTQPFGAVNPPATVTFSSGGGSGTMANQVASAPTTLSANTFTRAGYEFDYWSDFQYPWQTYQDGASYSFSSDATLVANWVAVYPVTYDTHGGSPVAPGTFRSGGSIATLPSAPTRAGYSFDGWFAAASGGTALTNGYSPGVQGPITLHAQWTPISNAVTYNTQGGSSVSAGSFLTGGSITLPSAPTRSGYTFNGWFTAANGGSALSSPYTPVATSAITLYAQWTLSSATVTFNANNGTGTMASQTAGSPTVLSNVAFSRTGFGFTGWNTAANGSGTSYANGATYPFGSSTTLYAQWRQLPSTPVAKVEIQVPVGQPVANAPVALDVDGLKDQTGYTVTVFSTPQIIDQGVIWSGRLNKAVTLPANLAPGEHRLVVDGIAADGSAFSETLYFTVSASGTLLKVSSTASGLASTGSNLAPLGIASGLLVLGGLTTAFGAARRRRAA